MRKTYFVKPAGRTAASPADPALSSVLGKYVSAAEEFERHGQAPDLELAGHYYKMAARIYRQQLMPFEYELFLKKAADVSQKAASMLHSQLLSPSCTGHDRAMPLVSRIRKLRNSAIGIRAFLGDDQSAEDNARDLAVALLVFAKYALADKDASAAEKRRALRMAVESARRSRSAGLLRFVCDDLKDAPAAGDGARDGLPFRMDWLRA